MTQTTFEWAIACVSRYSPHHPGMGTRLTQSIKIIPQVFIQEINPHQFFKYSSYCPGVILNKPQLSGIYFMKAPYKHIPESGGRNYMDY